MRCLTVLLILSGFLFFAGCAEDEDSPVETSPQIPEAPSGLSVNATIDRSISLDWTDNADDEDYFHVERAIDTSGSYIEIAKLGADVETFTDENLTPGVTYCYRVRAGSMNGFSDYSNEASEMALGRVTNPELRFANDIETTPTRHVNLLIAASEVTSMLLSNSAGFEDAEWENFAPLKVWTLETGTGTKTVYLRLANQYGDTTDVISASVEPETPEVEIVINDGAESTSTRHVQVTLVADGGAVEMQVGDGDWEAIAEEFDFDLGVAEDESAIEVEVKVRNDFLIEANDIASIQPEVPSVTVSINDGADSTDTRYVILTLSASGGATEMTISNQPYSATLYAGMNDTYKFGKDIGLLRGGAGLRARNGEQLKKQQMAGTETRPTSHSLNHSSSSMHSVSNPFSHQSSTRQPSNIRGQELDETDEWIPFEETVEWELNTGSGTKRVYVKVRNDFELEAEDVALIEPLPPVNPSVQIITGGYDENHIVSLYLNCDRADSMMISNSEDFEDADWIGYRQIVNNWDLSGGGDIEPEMSVFARFRNDFDLTSEVVSDTVDVRDAPMNIQVEVNHDRIAAYGTGGNETTLVRTFISSQSGEPVENNTKVFFLMTDFPHDDSPDGCDPVINRTDAPDPEQNLQFDSSRTNNGMAVVSVSSGTALGFIELTIWAYSDESLRGTPDVDSTLVVCENCIEVVAGPPAIIELEIDENVQDGGGAIWLLQVSAVVIDNRNNPVADSITVQFEVEPEIATISNGFTGNEDWDGETCTAVAYTTLAYHSSVTNDSVNIIATALSEWGEPAVATLDDFRLPICQAGGSLYADPRNWNFRNQPDPAVFHLTAFVYDGHDHPVNKQMVRFLTTRGLFYLNAAGGQVWNEAYTGPPDYPRNDDNDEPGWANRYLRIPFEDAFPDPRILETTATVEVEIIGCPDADVNTVILNLQH